jgi:hypothetical protein
LGRGCLQKAIEFSFEIFKGGCLMMFFWCSRIILFMINGMMFKWWSKNSWHMLTLDPPTSIWLTLDELEWPLSVTLRSLEWWELGRNHPQNGRKSAIFRLVNLSVIQPEFVVWSV